MGCNTKTVEGYVQELHVVVAPATYARAAFQVVAFEPYVIPLLDSSTFESEMEPGAHLVPELEWLLRVLRMAKPSWSKH